MIKLLTPYDVHQIIGISLKNTYKIFQLKDFPKIKIGNKMFVKECDLVEFLDSYKQSKIILG